MENFDYPEYDTLETLGAPDLNIPGTKYKCDICLKVFKSETFAKEHTKYFHTGETPFECDICGKCFMYSRSMAIHRHSKHSDAPPGTYEKYICTPCDKHYTSANGLRNHKLRHHNVTKDDRSVPCGICDKRLCSRGKLSIHMRTHTGVKPFSCDICKKSFARKEQMKEHQRVHTGEKPYKCQFCGRGFAQRTPMKTHERIHTKKKPYSCEICKKRFASTGALGTHKKFCIDVKKNIKKEATSEND